MCVHMNVCVCVIVCESLGRGDVLVFERDSDACQLTL